MAHSHFFSFKVTCELQEIELLYWQTWRQPGGFLKAQTLWKGGSPACKPRLTETFDKTQSRIGKQDYQTTRQCLAKKPETFA